MPKNIMKASSVLEINMGFYSQVHPPENIKKLSAFLMFSKGLSVDKTASVPNINSFMMEVPIT